MKKFMYGPAFAIPAMVSSSRANIDSSGNAMISPEFSIGVLVVVSMVIVCVLLGYAYFKEKKVCGK